MCVATPQRQLVWVVDRHAARLPFSKHVLTASLTTAGVGPETAFAVAQAVEERLAAAAATTVDVNDLLAFTATALRDRDAAAAAARHATWVAARRAGRPILILLGGTTGVGKSSVAAGAGGRLRITTVLPTDAVRQVMRHAVSASLAPILHTSSFDAWRTLRAPLAEEADPVVEGFRLQADAVGRGIEALVERSLHEASDLIVEGVHVVPGLFSGSLDEWQRRAVVIQTVLQVADATMHRAHFLTRLDRAPQREPQRYLDHFDEIRRIGRYIVRQAAAHEIPVIEVSRLDDVIQAVVDRVVDAQIAAHEG